MLDFSAIDDKFLTRFLFAFVVYWLWGIFSKGIFEPIQAYLGKNLILFTNKKTQELTRYADLTCSQIDDFIVNHLADNLHRLSGIVNGSELPPSDRRAFRQLVTDRYQLALLLEKLGIEDGE
jgi:hypothetical protein